MLGAASILAVLVGIGHFLDVADPLAKADAIVAISGDTGARANTAIALWKRGYAPLLIFSGGSKDPESVASAELMKRTAVAGRRAGERDRGGRLVRDHRGERGPRRGADERARAPLGDPRHESLSPAPRGDSLRARVRAPRRARVPQSPRGRSGVG